MRILPISLESNIRYTGAKKEEKTEKSDGFLSKLKNKRTKDKHKTKDIYMSLKPATKEKLSLEERKRLNRAIEKMTPEAETIYKKAIEIAIISHSPKLEIWHLYLATLLETRNYLKKVNNGSVDIANETRFTTPMIINSNISENFNALENQNDRNKIIDVLNNHIEDMKEKYVQRDKALYTSGKKVIPMFSKKAAEDLLSVWSKISILKENDEFTDGNFLIIAKMSQDAKLRKEETRLNLDMQKAILSESTHKEEKNHIEFYDKKADIIWKNIAYGNNVLVLNDKENKNSFEYLISSFTNLINKKGQKYGDIDANKINIISLSDNADIGFLCSLVKDIKSNKSNKDITTVIIGDWGNLLQKSGNRIDLNDIVQFSNNNQNDSTTPNIKFIMSITPENYHINTSENNEFGNILKSYAQQSLPILNAHEARKYLTNENGQKFIEAKTGKKINEEAIAKAIEITSTQEGNFPDKSIDFLETVSKYFIDEKEIKTKHINEYLKETAELSETSNVQDNNIIFDTGKTLDDIKGMPMTKTQAESIAKQILKGTIGTRGIIIQHNSGNAYGGGRRHTIESIAGSTGVPIITINAKDFALKDIDALSQQAGLSEIKIKKLISTAKAQAEANRLATAIIYIENFDNFCSNPLYGISSIYEQKAFTQLLSEMDKTRKDKKVNLIIVGSMNMPDTIDENILKPYKFLNQINVFQPQDKSQREEIINYYIEKNNIKIAGDTKAQQKKVIDKISESTENFTVVDLIYLLDNAKIISEEREKNAIDNSDFIESYLQTTSGITNPTHISDADKKITTSHETGHAIALQTMYNIAKKQNIPWHLPNQVNFITLDPRGEYAGAMFSKHSNNTEYSFERVISDIVCDYGGHSAENILYNMQGSWGITCDMEMAENEARLAVINMGMGAKTGVRYSNPNFLSNKQKEEIESDIERILSTGKLISDEIISKYKGFIEEFTEKYYSKVGTGECIIPSEEFINELNNWIEKQPSEKRKELQELETTILKQIKDCKEAN